MLNVLFHLKWILITQVGIKKQITLNMLMLTIDISKIN